MIIYIFVFSQVFDEYKNHVREHETISLKVDGFCILKRGSDFKVSVSDSQILMIPESFVIFYLFENIFSNSFQTSIF